MLDLSSSLLGPHLIEELWEGGLSEEPNFGPQDGFAMIEWPRLKMQFVPTAFEGCRHWGSLELVSLEELIGPAAQRI